MSSDKKTTCVIVIEKQQFDSQSLEQVSLPLGEQDHHSHPDPQAAERIFVSWQALAGLLTAIIECRSTLPQTLSHKRLLTQIYLSVDYKCSGKEF